MQVKINWRRFGICLTIMATAIVGVAGLIINKFGEQTFVEGLIPAAGFMAILAIALVAESLAGSRNGFDHVVSWMIALQKDEKQEENPYSS